MSPSTISWPLAVSEPPAATWIVSLARTIVPTCDGRTVGAVIDRSLVSWMAPLPRPLPPAVVARPLTNVPAEKKLCRSPPAKVIGSLVKARLMVPDPALTNGAPPSGMPRLAPMIVTFPLLVETSGGPSLPVGERITRPLPSLPPGACGESASRWTLPAMVVIGAPTRTSLPACATSPAPVTSMVTGVSMATVSVA